MLYGLKEVEERLHFLLRGDAPVQTFQEMNALQSVDLDFNIRSSSTFKPSRAIWT